MCTRSVLACLIAALVMTGCGNDQKTASTASPSATIKAVNTTCPIGGHEAVADESRTWKGTTIAFCCSDCTVQFDKMADAQKDGIVTLAKANKVAGGH